MNEESVVHEALTLINQIADCATNDEANDLVTRIIKLLGAGSFVYMTILPPQKSGETETYTYMLKCDSKFCELYNSNKWMLNDPFLDYAKSNSQPIFGSKVKLVAPGQREMLVKAAQHGFRTGMVIPNHTSLGSNKRMGLLYIGTDMTPETGEPILSKNRVLFGAIGTELLLWTNKQLKDQAMRKYSLLEDEIELLKFSKAGLKPLDISVILNQKTSKIYNRLSVLRDKFDVEKIDHAVVIAESIGLLE